ncbi:MAG: hypothetical protein AAF360_18265, partial [Pseudomonadota bacterium]
DGRRSWIRTEDEASPGVRTMPQARHRSMFAIRDPGREKARSLTTSLLDPFVAEPMELSLS